MQFSSFQVYSPGADDIMHPGDALAQSHYSPKGGIYTDSYYMGKNRLYDFILFCIGPSCACLVSLMTTLDEAVFYNVQSNLCFLGCFVLNLNCIFDFHALKRCQQLIDYTE